ncbi:hypothetical protein D3C80_1558980 [compost metagenome]
MFSLQNLQGQVQTRHVNATRAAVIQADPGVGAGVDPLPGKQQRQGDCAHADPVQGLWAVSRLAGNIRKGQGVHQKSGARQW